MLFTAKEIIYSYKENELIPVSKVYREKLYGVISEPAYYKMIERMCKSAELMKIAKGLYYRPKRSKYGIVPPSEKEIVSAFTENRTGTIIGYTLYNSLGLTTQVSKNISVLSSRIEGDTKTIRNISLRQVPFIYSKEINQMIHCLEVLQNFNDIQDIDYNAFLMYTKCTADEFNEKVFDEVYSVLKYKKVTISFLHEILNYYGKENNLNKYLSTLSEYNHPKMGEIYELAQFSRRIQ